MTNHFWWLTYLHWVRISSNAINLEPQWNATNEMFFLLKIQKLGKAKPLCDKIKWIWNNIQTEKYEFKGRLLKKLKVYHAKVSRLEEKQT